MTRNREVVKRYTDIGKVTYRKNARARNISIRVKPFKGIVVTVPRFCSFGQAEHFVFSKSEWLTRSLERMRAVEDNRISFNSNSLIHTRQHVIRIVAGDIPDTSYRISYNQVTITYPEVIHVENQVVQRSIRDCIVEIYRLEAKQYLPERLAFFAELYGYKYHKVFIKNLKSRWGSCSGRNNINLNLHLMRLPDHLIDYVLIHELTHTEIKNHSPKFWQQLEKNCPGARTLDKELNRYHIAF
jgi:predicted metal-dependent hydrolase